MKNILISGGSGFIGSNLSLRLLKLGYTVRVLDNLSQQVHGKEPMTTSPLYQSIKDKVEFFNGNVTCKKDWIKAIEGQDAIIHLAAETGTGQSMYQIKRYIDVNIVGTSMFLDILTNKKNSIQKIILASSRAVYGEGKYKCPKHSVVYPMERREELMKEGDFNCKCPICFSPIKPLPTSEDSELHPISIYGITKHNQEQLVINVGKALQIPFCIFRFQNVYGPGQPLLNPYTGILSIFSTQIKNKHNINIFEDGKERRDFVYISDAVDAIILGLIQNKISYDVFNVGSGESKDVLTVAKTLKLNFNSNINIVISGNYRIGDIRHNYASLTKIQRHLNFIPKYTFSKGLKLFCEWVNNQDIPEDNYLTSIFEMKRKGFLK